MALPPLLRAALCALALAAATPAASRDWWLEPGPRNDAEKALAAAVVQAQALPPEAGAAALVAFAEAHPQTAEAGLARLAAGRMLIDADAGVDRAAAVLTHPDVAASGVAEWAGEALATALADADRPEEAAAAWLQALERRPDAPFACEALRGTAAALEEVERDADAAAVWRRSLEGCRSDRPQALSFLARHADEQGRPAEAAALYDRLDREFPASSEALQAAPRLAALSAHLPALPERARLERALRKARALLRAARHADAAGRLRVLLAEPALAAEHDRMRLDLARAEAARRRFTAARQALAAIPANSPLAAEAAFEDAEIAARRGPVVSAYESVAARFPGTRWAQEALFALGNHFQKDALDDRAVPFYRRLYDEYPEGPFLERVTWRVGWSLIRHQRFEEAARVLEGTARKRATSSTAGIFLYWAGTARARLGQTEAARGLFAETVRRFKHTYHGQLAQQALDRLPPASRPAPALPAVRPVATTLPERTLDRLHRLVLIGHFEAAAREVRASPGGRGRDATLAWLESRAGRPAPAIRAIARAYPQYQGAVGDSLPPEVWQLLYPLPYADALRSAAAAEGVEPALVAALIRQESEFDATATSVAGARGLMQIMPGTGRRLARQVGLRFRSSALYEAETSLRLGARYLRQMLDRFDGRVERALAAYNAGPHRVDAWEKLYPGLDQEAFVESIPFTQTRLYVRKVLANRHHYRRLYGAPGERGAAR